MKKTNWIWIALAGILIVVLIFGGLSLNNRWQHVRFDRMQPGMMANWDPRAAGLAGMFLMWLIPAGLFILVILGIIGLARVLTSNNQALPGHDSEVQPTPQEILKSRYARGDISREEFLQMRDDLA
jgi:putative membrane protein